jgi:hypothetical protein
MPRVTTICVSDDRLQAGVSASAGVNNLLASLLRQFPHVDCVEVMCDVSPLTDVGFRAIAEHCPELRTLDISGCRSDDPGGAAIVALARGCPHLQHLTLGYTLGPVVTAATMEAVARHCEQLSSLALSHLDADTVPCFGPCAGFFTRLRKLCLQLGTQVEGSDDAVIAFAEGCPTLTSVAVCGSAQVSDRSCRVLARTCPSLRELNVERTGVTAAGLAAVARGCPRLETLVAASTAAVSDALFSALADSRPPLGRLLLGRTSGTVSAESLEAVVQRCERLQVFVMPARCIVGLTDTTLDRLGQCRPGCFFDIS